ncbi:hypothetical protein CDAR_236741 [Caerostris darwini]|uniref:Uncharacterized protein n=1 Tax=Caerostris darwini TaxID=1538125 RepID=A0AAV4QS79_9ARAC|nr:hypothetical protein CDAR_236741 [Caerostris darwini]
MPSQLDTAGMTFNKCYLNCIFLEGGIVLCHHNFIFQSKHLLSSTSIKFQKRHLPSVNQIRYSQERYFLVLPQLVFNRVGTWCHHVLDICMRENTLFYHNNLSTEVARLSSQLDTLGTILTKCQPD